jgi:hypothetical protein
MTTYDIQFSFQTNFLPPPFAFAYVLGVSSVSLVQAKPVVKLEIEYLDREEFSEEMLLEEGAPIDDYFEWSGELDAAWAPTIKSILNETELIEKQDENLDYLYLTSKTATGHVQNVDTIQPAIQEIIQAIYETAKVERPLLVEVYQGPDCIFAIEASFATRQLTTNNLKKNWKLLHDVLAYLENFELNEAPAEKGKAKKGIWITYDQANYYKVLGLEGENDANEIANLLEKKLGTL